MFRLLIFLTQISKFRCLPETMFLKLTLQWEEELLKISFLVIRKSVQVVETISKKQLNLLINM